MKLFLRSASFLVFISFASLAFGSPDWTNTGFDNFFDNGANWTTVSGTGTVPGPADSAHIFPGFTTAANSTHTSIDVISGAPLTTTITTINNQSVESLLVSSNFLTTTVPNGTLDFNFLAGSTLTVGADAAPASGVVITGQSIVNYTGNLQLATGTLAVGTANSFLDSGQVTGAGALNVITGTFDLDSAAGTSFVVGNGSIGTVTQGNLATNSSSTVNAGQLLQIGLSGGTGIYSLTANSTLNIGNLGSPQFSEYLFHVGEGSGSVGVLNVSDNSTINASNPGTILEIGVGSNATGTVTQSGTSTVNLGGALNLLFIGDQGTGTYNLQSGNLNISNLDTLLGINGGTGTLAQSGGTLIVGPGTTFIIGDGGTGTYTLSNGSADFQNGFEIANGGLGIVTQSGGTLTTENTVADIGLNGTGIYNLQGGTAIFSSGVIVGATGTITQTGGTLTVPLGQSLDLSSSGAVYNLNGGVLRLGNDGVTNGLTGVSGQGVLNFGGGTLQALSGSSTTLTDGLDGTLTNNSTLDTSNADIVLSGNLGGTGGFTLTGGGTVTLNATDTYLGPTIIGGGNTLNLEVPDATDTFASSIGGTGNLNIDFLAPGNTVELAGTSNFTGTTTLGNNGNSGTLKVFSGTFGDIGETVAGNNVTIGGDPSVATSGTVNFTGTNSYTGLTTINPGFTLHTSNLNGNVSNLGMFGSGLTPSTLPLIQATTVAINGAFNSSGTFVVNTNGTTTDLYTVTSASNSTLTGHVLVTGVGTIAASAHHVILDATAGGGILDASGLATSLSGAGVLFTATVTQVGNTLEISTTQLGTAAFAKTRNQLAVAGALDPFLTSPSAAFSPGFLGLGTALNNLSAAQIPGALDQLSPENLQYMRDIAFENSTFMVQEVNGYLTNLRNGYSGLDTSGLTIITPGFESSLGRSLGSLLAYNSPAFNRAAPNGVNYYPQDDDSSSSSSPISRSSSRTISDSPDPLTTLSPAYATAHYEGPNFSEFIGGDVILAELNQNQSALNAAPGKASYTAGSASAGVSFRVTANLAVGALMNYNHTDAKTDSNGSKIKVDSYSPGIYTTFFKDGFYANGLFSYGYNSYSETRNISFAGLTAKGSPNGSQYVGNLDFGYDFQPEKHWIVGPTLGVTYTHLDVDSFNETGAGPADLNVASQSADSVRSRFGGHVIYQTHTGSVLLQPNFTAMWQHEYLNGSSGITSQFNIPGTTPFSIQTAAPSRDSALLGLGMTATLDNSMVLYLNYLADVGAADYFAQSVEGGFKARF